MGKFKGGLLGFSGEFVLASAGTAYGATADFAIVSNTASASHARVGETVTFTITARNNVRG